MRNIKLLIVTALFSSLLIGCGMKGPLFRTGTTDTNEPVADNEKMALVESQPAEETIITDSIDDDLMINDAIVGDVVIEESQPLVITGDSMDVTSTEPQKVEPAQDPLFTSKSTLFSIDPSHYTLQLVVMESESSLQRFVMKHNLPQKNVYVYQTTKNNTTRYVVIFGDYMDKQSAKMASKNLPGSFANMDTWAKPYELVHQDLLLIK